MIKDYFKFAYRSIITRKLRSWLTVIGIFIGIATVVALIAVGQGMEDAINEQFEKLGTDKIVISAGGEAAGGAFGMGLAAKPITMDDLDVVQDTRGVDVAAGMITRVATVKFRDEVKSSWINGYPTDESADIVEDIQSYKVIDGRNMEEGDGYDAVIGNDFAYDFFENDVDVGDDIVINEEEFKVIGVLDKIGNRQDDTAVSIPMDTAKELFDTGDEIYGIMVRVDDGQIPLEVAERIKEDLRDYRDEEEGEESFSVQTFEQILEQVGVVLGIISAVLIGIAGISLLVGGVGIMNTMYTAVLERTKDIGIMKSIGATNKDVMMIFLLESGMYGLVGGVVGVVSGSLLSLIVAKVASFALGIDYFRASITWWLVVGALLFSFIVGCVSGVLPAKQAASLKPADALRYE